MYTQCPDCTMAFRVSADVLKQAAGMVRCGGCGNAFNALDYLSEAKPSAPPSDETEEGLPELAPELLGDDVEPPAPQKMSAEQSAALLKTLDDLAGSNIRLEDTGVEWRLLPDTDEDVFGEADRHVDAVLPDDAGDSHIDELLDDTPGGVDEFLTATPDEIDAAEIFDGDSEVNPDELRFDDNTGLPEGFDFGETQTSPTEARDESTPEVEFVEPIAHTETNVDLVFGDPDEWSDLLDEVVIEEPDNDAAATPAVADLREAVIAPGEPAGDEETEPSFEKELDALPDDDDDGGDGDQPLDIDTQFGLQAEALGIDTSAVHDIDDDDASIEEDLIAAAFETEKAVDGEEEAEVDELQPETVDESPQPDEPAEPDDDVEEEQFPGSTGELEYELARAQEHSDEVLALLEEDIPIDAAIDESAATELEIPEPTEEDIPIEEAIDESAAAELELPGPAEEVTPIDAAIDESAAAELEVPELTEEEQTINRMIDQDLLRLAIDDEDGVASTMVLQGKAAGDGKTAKPADESDAADETANKPSVTAERVGVETIIMEGEFVRTALEQEALEASANSADADDDDKETGFIAIAKRTFRGEINEADADGRKIRHRLVAGIAILSLLLTGQFIHQSRAELATIPAVNTVLTPVYRAIGAPITPEWDVTGWRFEVTRGSTNATGFAAELQADGTGIDLVVAETDDTAETGDEIDAAMTETVAEPEVLTIYSRIGNKSDKPLPYPLVSVSLTDRFEEIIGSKVVEPRAYLTGDSDPGRHVPPSNTFDAVIEIESPAVAATGFKLNVCYRQAGGKLRCAVEDFK